MGEAAAGSGPYMDRRGLLRLSAASVAGLAWTMSGMSQAPVWADPRLRDDPFQLGVCSGDPLPDGVVLWTRLAMDPLAADGRAGMPNRVLPVQWQVAEDERFRRVVRRGQVNATPELGHAVHAEVTGLAAGREYFYRFKAGGQISPTGRTKTLPPLSSSPAELAFAVVSCQMYEHGHFTAYRHIAEEDLDLVVHLGDYIYEYGRAEYPAASGNVRLHSPASEVFSLSEYRIRHAQYKTDSHLQAAHAAFPWLVTWDDHEVENNYADAVSEADDEPDQDPAMFLRRRAAAYQAYYEHMPLRRSSMPRGPQMPIYRRLSYGDLAEFSMLDTRQYRDDQANGDGLRPPNQQTRSPDRSLTGAAQEKWLLDGLANSQARWNVLAQQVFFAELDLQSGPGELYNMDAWDGYTGQRDRILASLAQRQVSNPVVLTGDIHTSWANDLLADFSDPNSPTVGTEYIATSVTSGGNGTGALTYGSPVPGENPHIKFFNEHRGYLRCIVTPDQWQADYRVVPFVNAPGAPVLTAASFVTENGNPGAHKASGAPARGPVTTEFERDRIKTQQSIAQR